jgi:hypothetical protein
MVINHIDPDGGDRWDLWNGGFYLNVDTAVAEKILAHFKV